MLHFGYICRATCELFLFARLSREGTEDYLFPYLLLGGGEGWGWGRESKTIKKKKSLRKLKFLQWAKSVPPPLSSFLFSLPGLQPPWATLGTLNVAHSLLPQGVCTCSSHCLESSFTTSTPLSSPPPIPSIYFCPTHSADPNSNILSSGKLSLTPTVRSR